MQRDMDLVRKILLAVEKEDDFPGDWRPEIDDHSPQEIGRHVELMKDRGLLDVDIAWEIGSSLPIINLRRMTWEGHEFLDLARKDSIWNQAKAKVLETTGALSIELLKPSLLQLGKQALE